MNRLRLHRYTKALLAAFGVFSLGLLGTCILILNQVQGLSDTAEQLHIHPFAVSNAALEAKTVLTLIREQVLFAALSRNQDNAATAMEEISLLDDSFIQKLQVVSDFYLGDRDEARQVLQLFGKWRSVRDGILKTVRDGEFEAARDLVLSLGTPAYEDISSKLDTIVLFARQRAALLIDEARKQTAHTQRTVYLIIVLGFAASFSCGIYMVRNVQRAICHNEDILSHKAHHDPLTGLPNRSLLLDRLCDAIELAKRDGTSVGVLFIDLDGFKAVNDTLGHDAGDELLALTARRLSDALRGGDTIARLGGDEFVVVIPGIMDSHAVARVAEKVALALNTSASIKGTTLQVSASLGLAIFPQDGSDPYSLMASADAAMYQAKSRARLLLPGEKTSEA